MIALLPLRMWAAEGMAVRMALGEVAAEGAVESNEALGTMFGVFVDLKVLRQDGVPVLATCDDHRAVGGVLASDDDGGAFGGVVRVGLLWLGLLSHDSLFFG